MNQGGRSGALERECGAVRTVAILIVAPGMKLPRHPWSRGDRCRPDSYRIRLHLSEACESAFDPRDGFIREAVLIESPDQKSTDDDLI